MLQTTKLDGNSSAVREGVGPQEGQERRHIRVVAEVNLKRAGVQDSLEINSNLGFSKFCFSQDSGGRVGPEVLPSFGCTEPSCAVCTRTLSWSFALSGTQLDFLRLRSLGAHCQLPQVLVTGDPGLLLRKGPPIEIEE